MSAWTTALQDLRVFLTDTPADNLIKDKAVIPPVGDGVRTNFMTFDDRLLASGVLSGEFPPLRVWVDGQEVASSGIQVVDRIRGEFRFLYTVPNSGQTIRASYYFQQFLDAELENYLERARELVNAASIEDVPEGLRTAVLHFAGSLAFSRLAVRWQQRKTQQFLLADEPARMEAEEKIEFFRERAQEYMETALKLRQQYYFMRMDRGHAPAYGRLARVPRPYSPRR